MKKGHFVALTEKLLLLSFKEHVIAAFSHINQFANSISMSYLSYFLSRASYLKIKSPSLSGIGLVNPNPTPQYDY